MAIKRNRDKSASLKYLKFVFMTPTSYNGDSVRICEKPSKKNSTRCVVCVYKKEKHSRNTQHTHTPNLNNLTK